ncbi:MAG: DUF3810 domain-containing protein [Bacteroidia bacterium]|nr:DUF3810 domain-containing protein [Bacteroidia bacterium]
MSDRPHLLSTKLRQWPWNGIVLGGITWLLLIVLRGNPLFAEVVYSQGIYALLRLIWDYTIGWLPFPLLYVVVPLLLFLLFRSIKNRKKETLTWHIRLRRTLLGIVGFAGMVLFAFYFSWGFNYLRLPIESQLNMGVDSLSRAALLDEYALATAELLAADSALGPRIGPIAESDLPENLEAHLRETERAWLQSQHIPAPGRPRGRRLFPKGLLMQLGASGIYIPFVAEGHIDAALPPATRPSTMAHELGHAFGFGDEGSCNFLAWITCQQSEYPAVRYSGALAYWRETANRLGWLDRERVLQDIEGLPGGIQADLAEIKAIREQYPGFFPQVSTQIYDEYLQAQGIEEGVLNYARVIQLVRAWRAKKIPR